MKVLIALLICVGLGYIAEIHFENSQQYVVWFGFTVLTFGAYLYLTKITSFAFAFPITATFVGIASAFAYIKGEPGIIIFGVYGAIGALILLGDKFLAWSWADWKSPAKLIDALAAPKNRK